MNPRYREHLLAGWRAAGRYALSPPRAAASGLAGPHLAHRPGSSLEFMDHRHYQPGDDLRRIDWSAYGRSDRLTVNLFREEVNPHLEILIDGSRSMALADSAKPAATLAMSALLAAAAGNAGYTHRAWLGGADWQAVPNGTAEPLAWEGVEFDYAGGLADSFAATAGLWRPRSTRVLISDLLWLGEPHGVLAPLTAGASSVIVLQLLARDDAHPPRHGNVRLIDSETGEAMEVYLDAAARQKYRDALARHQQNWHRAARGVGAVLTTLLAEDVLADWDLDDLLAAGVLRVA